VLGGLLRDAGTGGNLATDAHLAALAIEHRAEIVSYDRDFARFPGIRHRLPG
jgi:predicted nucleic acid-binding protein